MSLKKTVKILPGIPWLRDHDEYESYYPKIVKCIKEQVTTATVMPPYRTPPYSGKFQPGKQNLLNAIMDRMNAIIDHYMTTNATHLWMVDGDVEPPPHALDTLLRLDVDIASGVYPFHNFLKRFDGDKPCRAMMCGRMGNDPCGFFAPRDWAYLKDIILGEEEKVSGGSGCMLVKRRVFKTYNPQIPPLRFTRVGPDLQTCGADVSFWKKAQDAGFTGRLHGGVVCSHLPEYPLSKISEWLNDNDSGREI